MTEILKCPNCNSYTIKEICDKCNIKTLTIKSAKFSIEDKQGYYRRLYKKKYKIKV